MDKPQKPSINIPTEFASNGVKTDFTAEKLLNGFPEVTPDVLAGDNLNKFIDDVYKALNYTIKSIDYIYSKLLAKEIHIRPEITANENGEYIWIINHNFGHSNIKAFLYDNTTNLLLWGEPQVITDTEVHYISKKYIEPETLKAVLIG